MNNNNNHNDIRNLGRDIDKFDLTVDISNILFNQQEFFSD